MTKLLEVKNLKTYFYTEEGVVRAVDDVSFSLEKGEILGLVGESGCGKSVTAMSITQLIQSPPGKIVGGEIIFEGADLLKKSKREMRAIRGNKISMVFQEPMTALNPLLSVGFQIRESLRIHKNMRGEAADQRAIEMLRLVGIPLPERRLEEFPHQLSGGMRQRVMIAIALCCDPDLLICDEPTTALDVTIQAQILELLLELNQKLGTTIIFITHDLGVIAQLTQNIVVMYAGKIVEYGNVKEVLTKPKHPYTAALLDSIPTPQRVGEKLHVIKGMVPSLSKLPAGCSFHPRCQSSMDICLHDEPELQPLGERQVRCHLYRKEA